MWETGSVLFHFRSIKLFSIRSTWKLYYFMHNHSCWPGFKGHFQLLSSIPFYILFYLLCFSSMEDPGSIKGHRSLIEAGCLPQLKPTKLFKLWDSNFYHIMLCIIRYYCRNLNMKDSVKHECQIETFYGYRTWFCRSWGCFRKNRLL